MDRSLDEVDVRLGADDDHLPHEEHYSSGRRPHDERERSRSLENRDRSRSPRGRPSGGDIEGLPRGSGNKRVYVSNLHYDVKSKDLKTVFRRGERWQCGLCESLIVVHRDRVWSG